MAALTAGRPGSIRKVTRDARPVAASAKGFKGGVAMAILAGTSRGFIGSAGQALAAGQAAVAVGRFYADFDNTSGADGALTAEVEYFRERTLFLVGNDGAGTPVVVADRESMCNLLDDQTATDAAGPKLGTVYDVTSEGVWVEIFQDTAQAGTPSLIQSGTSTLVAGTKAITGLALTANSRILVTMKDPGAGAITAFAALDVPVGTRTGSAFTVNAIDNTKATIATAVCTFDWLVIG